ncbi:MAG: hypothetical protein ACYCQJ_09430 [Nitrososphaerales archaeon]
MAVKPQESRPQGSDEIDLPDLLDSLLKLNLRENCLDCKFIENCPVVESNASPEHDVLIGSYRISALKSRCLL